MQPAADAESSQPDDVTYSTAADVSYDYATGAQQAGAELTVDEDDYLTANMASTEALDHFDSQWSAQGTQLSPLHYAASLGKRRYLTLLLKQLKHSSLSERSKARLEHLKERGQRQGLNMVTATGNPQLLHISEESLSFPLSFFLYSWTLSVQVEMVTYMPGYV